MAPSTDALMTYYRMLAIGKCDKKREAGADANDILSAVCR